MWEKNKARQLAYVMKSSEQLAIEPVPEHAHMKLMERIMNQGLREYYKKQKQVGRLK
jgi:hypothetical protein